MGLSFRKLKDEKKETMLVITFKTVIWWPTKMSKIRQKSPSIYPTRHQLSINCFWHTKPKVERKQNQNQICSKLFLDQKTNIIHPAPRKNRRPGSPVMRKKIKKNQENLSQSVINI